MPEERFTRQARQVLTFAQEEAHRLKHNYIGTEHLVLGLLRVEDGVAARTLRGQGVTYEQARSMVEQIIGQGNQIPAVEIQMTPRAKRAIELGVEEARRLQSPEVDTQHLLLGLLREGEGIGADVLARLGADREKVYRALGVPDPGPAGPPPSWRPAPRVRQSIRSTYMGMQAASDPLRPGLIVAAACVAASLLIERRPRLVQAIVAGFIAERVINVLGSRGRER